MGKSNSNSNKNKKSNSYGPKKSRTRGEDKVNYKDIKMPNDPNWYAKSEQLLKDVASVPFASILGTPMGWNNANNDPAEGLYDLKYVPGIMRIGYSHSLGCGKEATDAPTTAARYIYTYVRHANSGSANYEAPDLYMMIAAWHSANAVLQQAKRAYGTMMHYLARNRFFAETVVRAMGFNFNSLRTNLAGFRTAINLYAARLNSIKVPGDMPIGKRWLQLASEYYVDGTSTKSQLYIPTIERALKYDGYGSETGTSLIAVAPPNTAMDVDTFAEYMESLLNPLTSEEDVGIMSGDIMKAFGDNVTHVEMIPEQYIVLPIVSDEMMMQIHNLCIPGARTNILGTPQVYQEDGIIKENVLVVDSYSDTPQPVYGVPGIDRVLLDINKESATPEDVMTMTRFIVGGSEAYGEGLADSHLRRLTDTGTEIVESITIYNRPTSVDATTGRPIDHTSMFNNSYINLKAFDDSDATTVVEVFLGLLRLSAFDWAPRLYFVVGTGLVEPNPVWVRAGSPTGEYDNYTVVDQDVVARLNKVAVLSELSSSSFTSV